MEIITPVTFCRYLQEGKGKERCVGKEYLPPLQKMQPEFYKASLPGKPQEICTYFLNLYECLGRYFNIHTRKSDLRVKHWDLVSTRRKAKAILFLHSTAPPPRSIRDQGTIPKHQMNWAMLGSTPVYAVPLGGSMLKM